MQLVIAPDNRLRIKTKPVKKITASHLKILTEMEKLARSFTDPEGVGLASTQIGEGEQFFLWKTKTHGFKAVFNPKILKYSKKTKQFFEGCLSIPNFYGNVSRPIKISVTYQNEIGQEVKANLSGMDAWIFQHEYDHLRGTLFMDHVLAHKSKLYKVVGKDRAGAEIFEEVPLSI